MDDGMVATDEIMLETKAAGKTARLRGTSVASAAEVYPGAPWMVYPVLPPAPRHRYLRPSLDVDTRSADPISIGISASLPQRCALLTDEGLTLDSVTGLYYARNRNYSPSLGRFISQDPLQYINGANTYQFVMGNPVNAVDPEGTDGVVWPTYGHGSQLSLPTPFPNTIPGWPAPSLTQQIQQDQAMAHYWENQALNTTVWSQNTADWEQVSKYQRLESNLLGQLDPGPPKGNSGGQLCTVDWEAVSNWSEAIATGLEFANFGFELLL